MFTVTYTQEQGPSCSSFEEYAERVLREFRALLDSDPAEASVQEFLERHPSIVPGAWTPGTKSSHGPFYNALIAQPRLPGFSARIPDFLWLSKHSGSIYAAMLEIEKPSKAIFTSAPVPTADFTQAYNQFAQWRVWFDSPANRQLFFDEYGITSSHLHSKDFNLHLLLVFGRRHEFEGKPGLSKLRSKLARGDNEELMSFERLSPDSWLKSAVTVTPLGGGRFRVKYVPDTFTVSPHNAHDLLNLEGWDLAIDANTNIQPDRREFLKRRVVYWVEWARRNSGGFCIGAGVFEE